MTNTETEQSDLAQELRAMLSRQLDAAMPETYDGRLAVLSAYLTDVTKHLESAPEQSKPTPSEAAAELTVFAHELSDTLRGAIASKSVEFDISPCDAAGYGGLALITIGAIALGPEGALIGFTCATINLVAACT